LIRIKRTSNIDYIRKLFIDIKRLNLIRNTKINRLTILAIYKKKKKRKNLDLRNNFEII